MQGRNEAPKVTLEICLEWTQQHSSSLRGRECNYVKKEVEEAIAPSFRTNFEVSNGRKLQGFTFTYLPHFSSIQCRLVDV